MGDISRPWKKDKKTKVSGPSAYELFQKNKKKFIIDKYGPKRLSNKSLLALKGGGRAFYEHGKAVKPLKKDYYRQSKEEPRENKNEKS